jgi:hypothetical protein
MKAKISLSKLMEKTRTIPVSFDGVTFDITYRVHALTPEFFAKEYLWQQLPLIIVGWEIGDEEKNGEVLPVTEAICRRLPTELQRSIIDACFEDARGPREEEKN